MLFRSAHDSLTVCGNKWFRHSQSKGGFPVDFVMEFYGKSFPEAVQMLTGELSEAQPEVDPAPSLAFRLPLRNVTNANILNYLTQERKLSPSLVNFFIAAGDIYEDAAHTTWSLWDGIRTGILATQAAVGFGRSFGRMQPAQKRRLALPIVAPTSSCWSLKRPSTCCPSLSCSRKTGSSTIICR